MIQLLALHYAYGDVHVMRLTTIDIDTRLFDVSHHVVLTGPVDNAKTAYYSNSAMLARLPYMI